MPGESPAAFLLIAPKILQVATNTGLKVIESWHRTDAGWIVGRLSVEVAMRGCNCFRGFAVLVLLFAVLATPVLAQVQEPRSSGWEGFLERADTGTITVILIFGTALVAVLGGMIPGIVRAFRGEVHTSEELTERISQLENRVALLERQTVNR